jgi:hypothetical protein
MIWSSLNLLALWSAPDAPTLLPCRTKFGFQVGRTSQSVSSGIWARHRRWYPHSRAANGGVVQHGRYLAFDGKSYRFCGRGVPVAACIDSKKRRRIAFSES